MTETVIMVMMMMAMTMMMMMMTTEAIYRFVCAVVQPTSYLVHHLHNDDRENHLHIISNKDDAADVMTTNRMMWRMMTKESWRFVRFVRPPGCSPLTGLFRPKAGTCCPPTCSGKHLVNN